MININEYIKESLNKSDIDKVKNFLMKKYKVSTWEECIDKQKFGNCEKIVKDIWSNFYDIFDCPVEIEFNFSKIAKDNIKDNKEMNANHYILMKDGKYYDFARGANCINGIYLLTQKKDNSDKYDIVMTDKELKYVTVKYKRSISVKLPKDIKTKFDNIKIND